MAQSFGASRFFIVKNVIFYEALPFIVAGAKTALGKAFIGLIVAEFYGIGQGLGRLISFYGLTYKIDKFMAVLAFILLISGLLLMGFGYLERRIQKWKKNLN
jgi:NitT/TauT family transport system permease protein